MSGFIEWLEGLNEKDSKARAELRRSLAFDPGTFIRAFPYVEPFVKDKDNSWRREMHYLVAGLWAAHWRESQGGQPMPFGKACAVFDSEKRKKMSLEDLRKTTSWETRLVTLVEAECVQLPHRLRQMVALLKEQAIDFNALLTGLLYWNDDQKCTQNAWARDFYKNMTHEMEKVSATQEEENE